MATSGSTVRLTTASAPWADIVPFLGTHEHVAVVGHGATTGQLKELLDPGAAGREHGNAVVYAYELDRRGRVVGP